MLRDLLADAALKVASHEQRLAPDEIKAFVGDMQSRSSRLEVTNGVAFDAGALAAALALLKMLGRTADAQAIETAYPMHHLDLIL